MNQFNNLENWIDSSVFFRLSSDLLCIADQSARIFKTSLSWEKFLGYSKDFLEGKNLLDLVHPEDRDKTSRILNRELAEDKIPIVFTNSIRSKDGSYLESEWRVVMKDNLVYAAARISAKTDETLEHLQQLEKAMDYSPVAIMITETNGDITYVNHKFYDLTGYSPEEVIGKKPAILKSGEQNEEFYRNLWTTIVSGNNWRGFFHNRKKNGEFYWESALIAPLFDREGRISSYIGIKEDITLQKNIEEQLRQSNKLLDLFFRQSLDGFFFMMLDEPLEWNDRIDKDSALDYAFSHQKITRINQAMLDQYGADEKDFIGLTPTDFYQHDIEYGKQVWRDFFDNGTLHVDTREQKFDGTPMTIEGDYICIYDEHGRITGHFGVQRDVSFERQAKEKLRENEELFRQLAENIDQVFFFRTEEKMLYVSPAYERIFGRSCQSLYDKPDSYMEAIHPEDREKVFRWYQDSVRDYDFEYRIVRPDGSERWIWASTFPVQTGGDGPQRLAGIARDISVRKQLERQIHETSIRDPLTGLYNRRHLFEILETLGEKAKRGEELFSLAILDIDHFKAINDTYGHVAGDLVLKELAQTLSRSIRGYDTLGRFGGEEFLIVFTGTPLAKAHKLMERILARVLEMSVDYEGTAISFTFSCGIADSTVCRQQECDLEKIIAEADTKLYRAKRAGRNRIYSS